MEFWSPGSESRETHPTVTYRYRSDAIQLSSILSNNSNFNMPIRGLTGLDNNPASIGP
jgi:hypothetical protein